MKRFAPITLAVSLLAVASFAPSLAAASPRSHPPHKKCGKPPRGHHHHHHGSASRSVTIYEVTEGSARPGSKVRLHGVVSAVASSGGRAWLAVAPGDPAYTGPKYSGLEVQLPPSKHAPGIEVGDLVTASGRVTADAAGTWLDVRTFKAEASGEPVEPLEVADTALLSPADPAALDAVLVRVPNLTAIVATSTETTMAGGLTLGNAIIGQLPVPFTLPLEFKAVTGIADTLGAGPPLLPRALADFDLGP